MPRRNRTTQIKREREQKKRDWQQKKAEKAAAKRERRLLRKQEGTENSMDPLVEIEIPES